MTFKRLTLLSAFAIGAASPAVAQLEPAGNRVGAANRPRPEYDAPGVQVGAFTVKPSVDVRSTYDDNVYATADNREDDVFFTLRPEVSIVSDLPRHSIAARAYYERDEFASHSSENSNAFGISARGQLDVDQSTRLTVSGGAEHLAESRSDLGSFFTASGLSEYGSFTGNLSLDHDFGTFRISGGASIRRLAYGDVRVGDVDLSQKFRDFTLVRGVAQASYSASTLSSVFIRGSIEKRTYDLRPGDAGFDPITGIDRSSNGARIEVGVGREITSLFYASARIGYLNEDYSDPKLRDVSGFTFAGDLFWNVTPLTTITASGERQVDETTSPITAGNLRTELRAGVDHELLRNLILSAKARYAWIDPSGLAPKSREQEFQAGARFLFTRTIQVSLNYQREQRHSRSELFSFSLDAVTLGLRFAL